MIIQFSGTIRSQIDHAAQAAYPAECCGLLMGRRMGDIVDVHEAHPVQNLCDANEQHHRYTIDPRAYLHHQIAAERAGLEIIGIFHSHPDHPAAPSALDIQCAWSGYVYVIVKVTQAGAQELTAWELEDAGAAMRPVQIAP